jgi:hypothetical protein
MMSRNWLNLVLLLAALALVGVLYLAPGKETEKSVALTNLIPAQVQRLKIVRPENKDVVLQRRANGWHMLEPVQVEARDFYVQQVLEILTQQSLQRYPAAGLDLAKYGLQPPRARLFADDVEFAFGRINPLNNHLYVMVDGVLHMVGQNDLSPLTAPWTEYVSTAVLPGGAQIVSLQVPRLGSIRSDEKGWRYAGGHPPSSADQMQTLADAWQNAQALEVKPLSERRWQGEVVLRLAQTGEMKLPLAMQGDELILRRDGLEYRFGAEQAQRMLHWRAPARKEAQ